MAGTEHRFCVRHLYANFKKKFGGGTLLRDLMMGAAKATYYEAWEEKMARIKEEKEAAYDWLMAIPTKQWCKHAFPFYSRCDVIMNNLSESFNATILYPREKPIITMFEWIRTYLMNRFATLREKVRNYGGEIMPKPLRRLDREIEKSGNWCAITAGRRKFQVTHIMSNDSFIVDLDKHTCSCNFWDLVGIPCRHAVVSIGRALETPQSYVHTYYHKKTYLDCYDQTITPINGQKMWPKTELPCILPPNYKHGHGRPKKLRRREPDEGSQGNWKRNSTTHRCKKCLKYGHNARTCKVPNPVKEKEATNGNDTNVVVTTNEGVVATVGSDTTMPSDNASLIQTQGSQTEPAPKKVICYSYSLKLNCMC